MTLWTPANLAVPPLVWIDSKDSSTITLNGSSVASIANKGSIGGAISQATASAQPSYSNGALVYASANSQNLQMNATMLAGLPIGNVAHCLIGASIQTVNSSFKTIGGWGTASAQKQAFLAYSGIAQFFSHYSADITGNGVTLGSPSIFIGSASPSAGLLYQNGTQTASGTFTTLNISNSRGDVGGGANGYLDGSIYKFLILGYVPSTSDRQLIEGWIAWDLGWQSSLPTSHPYYSAAPTMGASSSNTAFTVSPGAFAISGQPATFAHTSATTPAAFSIAGSVAMAQIMAAAPGSFALAGLSAGFAQAFVATPGALAITGQAAAFGRAMSALPGSYAISGAAAAFAGSIAESPGAYSIAGQVASFADGLPMAPGAFVITGQPATFVSTSTGTLLADPGAFTITGKPAAFVSSLNAAPAVYAAQGQAASFSTGVLAAAAGYSVAGKSVTFGLSSTITPAAFALGGGLASFASTASGTPAAYSITGLPVSFYGSAAPTASPPSRTISISVAGIRIASVAVTGSRTALV